MQSSDLTHDAPGQTDGHSAGRVDAVNRIHSVAPDEGVRHDDDREDGDYLDRSAQELRCTIVCHAGDLDMGTSGRGRHAETAGHRACRPQPGGAERRDGGFKSPLRLPNDLRPVHVPRGGDGLFPQAHHVAMELFPYPDRATAEADQQHLADLASDVACDLPVSRVRAYVDAYLNNLPGSKPTKTTASDVHPLLGSFYAASTSALAGHGSPSPLPNLAQGGPARPTKRGSFRPSLSMYVYAAIGVAVIVVVGLFSEGVLEKLGEGFVAALVAARAFVDKLMRDVRKRDDDEPEVRRPLADVGWVGQILSGLGFLAAAALLCGIFYATPRLIGFEVSLWAPGFAALLIVSLLAFEWGFIDPKNA